MTEEQDIVLNEEAVKLAVKLISRPDFEGCNLIAYPDPASDLYKALSAHNLLRKYMSGQITEKDLPDHFKALSGAPWTIGYGETQDVHQGDVWTQEEANKRLENRVREFMIGVIKDCPQLENEPATRVAACTSLAYNIGLKNFASSTVCKKTMEKDYHNAGLAILMWNKAGGKVMTGLDNRRHIESGFYMAG